VGAWLARHLLTPDQVVDTIDGMCNEFAAFYKSIGDAAFDDTVTVSSSTVSRLYAGDASGPPRHTRKQCVDAFLSLKRKKAYPGPVSSDVAAVFAEELAEELRWYVHLMSTCPGQAPPEHVVVPLRKPKACKAELIDASYYRPIALLPAFAKAADWLWLQDLKQYSRGVLLRSRQHGFLPSRNCELLLQALHDTAAAALENGRFVCLTGFDIKQAFPSITRSHLMRALTMAGADRATMCYAWNWCAARPFRVHFAGSVSALFYVLGLPQGALPSPECFSLCNHGQFAVLRGLAPPGAAAGPRSPWLDGKSGSAGGSATVDHGGFADDTTILTTAATLEELVSVTVAAVSALLNWYKREHYHLDSTKCAHLVLLPGRTTNITATPSKHRVFTRTQTFEVVKSTPVASPPTAPAGLLDSPILNRLPFERVDELRILGILWGRSLTGQLSFERHLAVKMAQAQGRLPLLKALNGLNARFEVVRAAAHGLIGSAFLFGFAIWGLWLTPETHRWIDVQLFNPLIRLVTSTGYLCRVETLRALAGWAGSMTRCHFQVISLTDQLARARMQFEGAGRVPEYQHVLGDTFVALNPPGADVVLSPDPPFEPTIARTHHLHGATACASPAHTVVLGGEQLAPLLTVPRIDPGDVLPLPREGMVQALSDMSGMLLPAERVVACDATTLMWGSLHVAFGCVAIWNLRGGAHRSSPPKIYVFCLGSCSVKNVFEGELQNLLCALSFVECEAVSGDVDRVVQGVAPGSIILHDCLGNQQDGRVRRALVRCQRAGDPSDLIHVHSHVGQKRVPLGG
jgi:hypothetical protein